MNRRIYTLLCLLLSVTMTCRAYTECTPDSASRKQQKEMPYKGYTGTVHQFGFIGILQRTNNPNLDASSQVHTYSDYGLGTSYTMHDYVTRQFTFEVITSLNVATAKPMNDQRTASNKLKMVWPVDCRFYLGPSEDFQAFVGVGLQWNMLNKTVGEYNLMTGQTPDKAIHQLSGNVAAGLSFFGPQNYRFHFNVGAKFHHAIIDNDDTPIDISVVDLSRNRSCLILCGGITFDIDRKKNACLLLNYEYPLGTQKNSDTSGLFSSTQTFSLGLVFHIGGTR